MYKRILSPDHPAGNGKHNGKSTHSPPKSPAVNLGHGEVDQQPQQQQKQRPAGVVIEASGKHTRVTADKLSDDAFIARLQARIGEEKHPIVHVGQLLDLSAEDRWALVDYVVSLNGSFFYRHGAKGQQHASLLTAILALMPESHDIERFARAKAAALEAAVLLYPDALEVACDLVLKRMREKKVTGVRIADLIKDARQIAADIERGRQKIPGDLSQQFVSTLFPNAPVAADLVVPAGWRLSYEGIESMSDSMPGTILGPVVIIGRGRDLARNTEVVRLAFLRDRAWREHTVDREVIASSRMIVDLAAFGLPVTSNNSRLLVQYLAAFESTNMDRLPLTKITKHLGYQGEDGALGFLWGTTLITAPEQHIAAASDEHQQAVADPTDDIDDGIADDIDDDIADGLAEGLEDEPVDAAIEELADAPSATQRKTVPVQFHGADEGDDQIAAGFHSAGSYEGWLRAIEGVGRFYKVRLAIYAALTAVMLRVLRCPNFTVDFAGTTTQGKTTVLRTAASCFGNPDEKSADPAAIRNWGATQVWLERAPAVLRDLPFIVDDTKLAASPEIIAKTIYLISQGQGKGRGSQKGTALQETFRTVMLSSGEQPIVSFTRDGGTRGRTINVWGSPFGRKAPHIGELVRELNMQLMQHYGHAGPRFVAYILKNRSSWPDWRDLYLRKVEGWEEMAGSNVVAGRLATYFAAISLTAGVAHECIDFPWLSYEPIYPLWGQLTREATDQATVALGHVMGWATSHQHEFFGRREEKYQPTAGWAGRWDCEPRFPGSDESGSRWDWIGFVPGRLDEILSDADFAPSATIRAWKDRGWLHCTEGRMQYRARLGKETTWFVAIRREAVDAACCGQEV